MKVAVLSGKGGTGKTFVSVNLSVAAQTKAPVTYIDCDVEEPNGRLFFHPTDIQNEEVHTLLPSFDAEKCNGCRKCVDFCHFHALVYIKQKPMLFSEVCHSCGGCQIVCPENAIGEQPHPVGQLEIGKYENIRVITGILNPGEASAVPVIHAALDKGFAQDNFVVIDCPPGSGCSVMESVSAADYALLVVEPTAFGFHNFQMVYDLVCLLQKPCGIVINKADTPYAPLENFCKEHHIPILQRIAFREDLAQLGADGKIASVHDTQTAEQFAEILQQIEKIETLGGEETI